LYRLRLQPLWSAAVCLGCAALAGSYAASNLSLLARVAFGVGGVLCCLWAGRVLWAGALLGPDGVTVRGWRATTRLRWDEVVCFELAPARFLEVTAAVRIRDGRVVPIPNMSFNAGGGRRARAWIADLEAERLRWTGIPSRPA
jgi:Bacterial PH domain